ncbi:hypothetical protein Tco_0264568 [Tanacetum coccineum]
MRNERISKVELAVYGVGQGGKVMGLFVGAEVEARFHRYEQPLPLPPRDQRHLWLRYQVEGYTEEIVHDFKMRIKTIFGTMVRRIRDEMGLDAAAEEMAEDGFGAYWLGSERVIPDKGDLSDYWVEIFSGRDFLRGAPSYTYIKDPVRRLCHRLISYSISGRGKAPITPRVLGSLTSSINLLFILVL